MNPVALYVHVPFCARKCPFCSFAVAVNQAQYVDAYLDALSREAAEFRGERVETVYVGGGTPSSLSDVQILRLFDILKTNFVTESAGEVTFECNPESVTPGRAAVLKRCGVNRVSLGVQTLNDRFLAYLGRQHRREDAIRAYGVLRAGGHRNISVDLMYGMAGQSRDDVDRDLAEIVSWGSEHVSIYALTVEERSLFFARKTRAPGAEEEDLYEHVCHVLDAAGVRQYEISNFCRPGYESRHNIRYWEGGEYIGIGMAAHSHRGGRRSWNADTLSSYLDFMRNRGHAIIGQETLAASDKMIEALLFGLRMNRGVDLGALQGRFGLEIPPEKIEAVESFIEMGLLEEDGMFLRATARGRGLLDEISVRLI